MRKYITTDKKVTIDGRKHSACYVKNHSRVKAIIFEFHDANYDGWANISQWVRTFYIMWKDRPNKWERIPNNDPNYEWAKGGMGWLAVLHILEDDKIRYKIEVKEEIRAKKNTIAKYQGEIKQLEKAIMAME